MGDGDVRRCLQRVAVHILARRRFAVAGRFGLRPSPGGLATPAFGDGPEVLRVSGDLLVREAGADATVTRITGATLRQLAAAAGADIDGDFSAGPDTPDLGDPDEVLDLDAGGVSALGDWWALGSAVLDAVVAGAGGSAATTQIWPEHFDAATTLTLANGDKVNLGFSPGDSAVDEPYCYVGPWRAGRPGDAAYWNAPFGATLTRHAARADHGADPAARCRQFIETGLAHLSQGAP